MKKLMCLLLVSVLLTGCSEKGTFIENTTTIHTVSLKETLDNDQHVKLAIALLHDKDLLVGIRVNTFSRFQKKKIASTIKRKFEKDYPELEITVSADSKVLLELDKLIKTGEKHKYQQKIENIQSIAKEQT